MDIGFGLRGADFWTKIIDDYELAPAELELLAEVCRTLDTADKLERYVDKNGVMLGAKVNPAVVELRQTRIALARLVMALRIPVEDDEISGQGRNSLGVRGFYSVAGGNQ